MAEEPMTEAEPIVGEDATHDETILLDDAIHLDDTRHTRGGGPPDHSTRIGRIYHVTSQKVITPAHSFTSEAQRQLKANNKEEEENATWRDVAAACFCHSAAQWRDIFLGAILLCGFLYFFLIGLDLLGTSFQVVGGCTAGSLLGSDTNPLASLMIGIVATALLHSSATATAIIVSLVNGGLDVDQGIYMVMGANIGTSVTSMIVSLAHMGDGEELERAFGGCSTLFVFNFYTVLVLFPLEIATKYLYHLTKAMLPSSSSRQEGESWESPIKKIISPLTKKVLIANKGLIDDISTGELEGCGSVYPTFCEGGDVSYASCKQGLIACDKKTNKCPTLFQNGADKRDDMVSGWVCLFISLCLLITCLLGLVALLHRMLEGASKRIIYKATNINGYFSIAIGCGVTAVVQSSSVTVSALVPLAGVGILSLEQMFPLVIGADIGTTVTALMASMVSSKVEALQIALVHVFFNITGAVLWYPVPFLRQIPLKTARKLGRITREWRNFPVLFILVVYHLLPILILGISSCFERDSKGFRALGTFLTIIIAASILYLIYWWNFNRGREKTRAWQTRRQRRRAALEQLADDMDYCKCDIEYVKNEVGRLKDLAGINVEEGVALQEKQSSHRRVGSHGQDMLTGEDHVSLYHSCQSQSWANVIASAGGSLRGSLHSIFEPTNASAVQEIDDTYDDGK
ncbi:solute carrier family 34 [Fistulifera solaris]|uniref:Solute carrier family 34 n=1 Tax=Fistulifera solaris TaxID=1519565 RepID=A0A1Z5JKE2_FISSO|nr:solute carrier family 34 [Fistulifera solaris]|eukprot:GAX14483.1 solute carrier family 34 [Fistulifera solaris]